MIFLLLDRLRTIRPAGEDWPRRIAVAASFTIYRTMEHSWMAGIGRWAAAIRDMVGGRFAVCQTLHIIDLERDLRLGESSVRSTC